ncbi:MAG: hypothetical protein M1587_05865 [Thaumarchaeota archaeon]|nr:hypothetical protein [Nitrososphaerota archaeon]
MVDCDYDGKIFKLDRVFWADDLTKEAGGLEEAKKLSLRIPKETFKGSQMMVIFCDRYGNEKSLLFRKSEFTSENKVKTNRRPKGRSRR